MSVLSVPKLSLVNEKNCIDLNIICMKLTLPHSKTILCLLFFFMFQSLRAQVILSESFEGGVYPYGVFPPAGWSVVNAGAGDNWKLQAYQPQSGQYSVYCTEGAFGQSNSWLFTPLLNLTTATAYRVSYWYKLNLPNVPFALKVTVGNGVTVASQNTVIHNYPAVINDASYMEGVDYFTVPANGNYAVAFNCLSGTGGNSSHSLEIDSIVIQQIPLCSGVPPALTATPVTSTICGGDTATIKLNGNYNFYGLSFQWQSSAVGANTFTNIPNATDTSLIIVPGISKDYRCVISCSLSSLSNNSTIATVNVDPTCYCHLAPISCQYAYIANVTLGGINNTSACSPQGFMYYSAVTPASIYAGASIPMTVTVSPGAIKHVGVWIDFDKNGRFDSTEFTNLGSSNGGIGNNILIPSNAVLGTTRMRVRTRYLGPFIKTDACTNLPDMTETEEYNVNILPLTACTITPVGGTTTSSSASICPLTNFTLSVTGSSINGVVESYQWQSSLNNITWTDIPNATNASLITQESVATYFRRKLICNNSLFAYSTSYLQVLSPFANCYCTPSISGCGNITITSVQFGTINNTSGCGLYTNYTATVPAAAINAGTFVPITVSFTANAVFFGSGYVKGWIDFNQNGVFENEESYNIASSGSNSTQTFLIRIPFDAKGGITRMRLRIETGGFAQMDPCVARTSGETEDYAVNITAAANPNQKFVVYVNKIATGLNNGSSWANALTSLANGFAIVKTTDTIKVAKGTYTPGYLLTDGVVYHGGYPDTGNPTEADRNFSANQTILTGQEIFGNQLHSNTILNGFIFDNLSAIAGFQAAIRLEYADPKITNCIFRNNELRVIYMYNSSPSISNCFFINNTDEYLNKGQLQLMSNSSPKITNCVFTKNTSASIINTTASSLNLTNCTFVNNKLRYLGSSIKQAEIVSLTNSTVSVNNSIFSDNWNGNNYMIYSRLTDSSNVITDNTSTTSVNNCITTYNQAGTNLLRLADAKFKDSSNAAGVDNLFFTNDDGLQIINPCSPAMNAGSNSAVTLNTDLLGNQRIVSAAVDLGAYEIQTAPAAVPAVLYVNAAANGTKDGSSWVNAFTDLQKAMEYCSDTIKVAAGNYSPSTNNQQAVFQLQNNRAILGGYPASGNPANNLRNPVLNQTILNGLLPNNTNADNTVQGVLLDSTAVLDGFVIKNAQSAGIYLSFVASPSIKNCVIKDNTAGAFVYKLSKPKLFKCTFTTNLSLGGISIDNSSPVIDSCSFSKNFGNSAIINKNRSLSIIKNSSFFKNYNEVIGGDIYNDNSDPQISNCSSDSAYSYFGASIANVNNSKPVITKCIFTNGQTPNYVSVTGGGVCYNNNSTPYFLNCSFINSKGSYGGAFYNVNSTVKLENCLGYGNRPSAQRGTSFMRNSGSTADIINCTIIKNTDGAEVFGNENNSILNIRNSILWNNNFNYTGDIYYQIVINTFNNEILNNPGSSTNISNSVTRIYNNGGTGNLVAIDPRFINLDNPSGADGIFGTNDDGLQLCSCSPAINTAINTALSSSIDITGSPRIFNTTADMGSYEYQSAVTTTSKTTYVNAVASGAHTGSSWAAAYNNLTEAINNPCSDTVKIMQGIYKPTMGNNRDGAFVINRKMILLGGYELTASPSETSRNADDYPTVLSGDIGVVGDTTDNSYIILQVNNTDTTVKVDGLTFTRCFSNKQSGNTIIPGGSIFSQNNKNLLIKNCRFYNNATKLSSSSLYSYASTLEVAGGVFSNNCSASGGTNSGNVMRASGATVKNCVFEKNINTGGSTVVSTGNFDFTNCIFYKNKAASGAGIFNEGVATLVNCNFIENTSSIPGWVGAGIYNISRAYLLNCIFNGNYTGNGQYPDWYDYRGANQGTNYYPDWNYFAINNCVLQTTFPGQGSVTASGNEKFVNISNPIGPDNKWFTADDGLKLLSCSPLIDKGNVVMGVVLENRNLVMPTTDIMDSLRTVGAALDVNAYEYPGYYNPIVKITATDSIICAGSSVTFTAVVTGAGANPVFQWQVNGINAGTNSSSFTTSLLNNNDQVKVILTSNDPCVSNTTVSSNIITMNVNTAFIPSVTIATGNTTLCEGTSTVFTATIINGGNTPSFQWQVNGINAGTNNNSFTTNSLTNNALVKVTLTSSFTCAAPASVTSNIITMTVNPKPVANAGNDVAICAGSSTQLNGSGGTSYSWSPVTGLNSAVIATPVATPAATTAYVLTVANNSNCTAKDTVVITVQPVVASPTVTITTPASAICMGTTVTFTASAINGGTNPTYQWTVNAVNAGANSNTFTSASFNNNDQVKLVLTSNANCVINTTATSNIVTMNVQQLVIPLVSLNNKVFTVTNPDVAAVYTWQVLINNVWGDIIPSASGTTYTASTAGEYRVKATKGACTEFSVPAITSFTGRVASNNAFGIYLYPNPATSIVKLDSIKIAQKWETIEVINANGQHVLPVINIKNQTAVSINVSSLGNGTYFIQLRKKDGDFTTIKFVKAQ